MANRTVTLAMPNELYTSLQSRALSSQRSIEDEAIGLLSETLTPNELPADLQRQMAELEFMDNDILERASRNQLAKELSLELEAIHLKQQREGLTETETRRSSELLCAYERAMLIRAQAAAVLARRRSDQIHSVTSP